MKIPLAKPLFDDAELDNLKKVFDSGWVTQGPKVAEFEKRFAELHKVKYAYAVNSCTSALHLAALAVGLKAGDEAIVPSFTWVTSANCIEYTGAKAVFCDIDINTFNMDPSSFEKSITPRTKAVVVVHLFGLSAEMDKIKQIAHKYNLKVIEDCACAVGTSFNKQPVGGIGDIGCFSFHPRKIITTGEGGMITTNNPEIAETVNSLRNHGCSGAKEPGPGAMSAPYMMSGVDKLGYNFRMSDIQAAVGIAQMDKLNKLLETRREWAAKYNKQISLIDELLPPFSPEKCEHSYQSYVIRIKNGGRKIRNMIMDDLATNGIWTRPGTHAVHKLSYYRKRYGIKPWQFPNSVKAENETITLPLFHQMSEHQFKHIISSLKKSIKKARSS